MSSKIYEERVKRFQNLMLENNIDVVLIRTLSSFAYFTGIKWLRPVLIIPVEGDPIAFIFEDEVSDFTRRSWIEEIRTWRRVEDLMRGISGFIRRSGSKVVGFDYSIERDAYVLFFEMFKKLTRGVEVKDVHGLIMQLRMIKDSYEIELINKASRTCVKGMEAAVDAIDIGKSELDIASEVLYVLMKSGSRHPLVYVNAGPSIKIHAEPLADSTVRKGYPVEIVIAADYEGYYSNITRTIFVGGINREQRDIMKTYLDVHSFVEEDLVPGRKLIDIQKKVKEIFENRGYGRNFLLGFVHGVGLLVEEDPITTIVPPHRQYTVSENMVLAALHSPLTIPGVGVIKYEDTYVIEKDRAKRITDYEYEIVK